MNKLFPLIFYYFVYTYMFGMNRNFYANLSILSNDKIIIDNFKLVSI